MVSPLISKDRRFCRASVINFSVIFMFFAAMVISVTLAVPSAVSASVSSVRIKVLILEDSYSPIPQKDEKIVKMGNLKGDLLFNNLHYVGNIEVWKGENGLYLINELSLEDYIESVVAAEVGTSWDMEALKAQAVISRTYALYKKLANGNAHFHLTSSVLHQAYKGINSNPQISYAVLRTAGEVLTYNGSPIEAFYHSTCGGLTENPEDVFGKGYPYLKPVASSCELSPYSIWERKISLEEIEKATNLRSIKNISINSRTSTGRAKELSVQSAAGTTIIKSNEFRKMLGWSRLPSTNFTIEMNGNSIVFGGKGYGHGVGLCQWSALQMARERKNYREILSFFYPGTEIKLYEGD